MASVKQQLVSILPHVTGFLSVIGNATIICDIHRRFRKPSPFNRPGTYHRLMLCMSATNMSAAIGSCLTTWPMPSGSAFQAFGNEGTCRAQAFFIQIGIAAPFYNLSLAIYYFLFIVKNTPSKQVLFVEKFMHPICLLYGVGSAIACLALDIFGPASFWCWIERGKDGKNEIFRWIFWHGPLWVIIAVVSVIMAVIYWNLRKQDRTQSRWSVTRPGSFMVGSPSVEGTADARDQEPNRPTNDNSLRRQSISSMPTVSTMRSSMSTVSTRSGFRTSDSFKWQSMWYLGSFYLNHMFLTAVRGMQAARKPVPFWLVLLAVTFTPSLGFFNAIVYFRPKYMQHRRQHPGVGRIVTSFKVAFPHCKLCGFSNPPWWRSIFTTERTNNSPSPDTEEPTAVGDGAAGHPDDALSSELNENGELP